MKVLVLFACISGFAAAQQTVAPSPDPAGQPRGENTSGYNIVDNIEVGYRFRSVSGDLEQYRSSVNFGDGVRVLGSSLGVNSRNGQGRLFDTLTITTEGLGNDPYQAASLRIEKNRLYRYNMTWRLNDYFNPGLVTGGGNGQHLMDTQYKMQDHDLTLFPQSRFKFFLGYTGTAQTGPAFTSIQLFDPTGNVFPLFSNLKRDWHEYRAGNEFELFGIRVNWMRGWEDFKEDTGTTIAAAGIPGIAAPAASVSALSSFVSTAPMHGTSPFWRVAVFRDRALFSMNGRFTYTAGRQGFIVDESALGTNLAGAPQNRQVISLGNAQRPVATGNLNLTFKPASKLTVVNSSAVYNIRTMGNATFDQFDLATQSATSLSYQYLGIRTVSNDTDVNYQVSPMVGLTTGYHYANRLITSDEQTFAGGLTDIRAQQTNQLHSGTAGLRIRPFKPVLVLLSTEIGTNDQPFYPVSPRNFHSLNGRIQYRAKKLTLAGSAQSSYNVNSISLTSFSSQSRTYTASGTWTPNAWLNLDASFTRMHLYTIGGIAYFLNSPASQSGSSIYLSNINSITLGARFAIGSRADLYAGYTRVQDLGDGRGAADAGIGGQPALFEGVQTFPVSFNSPLLRVSVRITKKVRWNAGYQYYRYRENFFPTTNFGANTGFVSISSSF